MIRGGNVRCPRPRDGSQFSPHTMLLERRYVRVQAFNSRWIIGRHIEGVHVRNLRPNLFDGRIIEHRLLILVHASYERWIAQFSSL